jgi:uncharacterized protein YkwD
MFRKVGALAVLVAINGYCGTTGASAATSRQVAVAKYQHFVLHLINTDRRQVDVSRLSLSSDLNRVAMAHSMDMAQQHYFSHISPQGESPTDRLEHSRIGFRIDGENLGWDTGQSVPVMLKAIEVAMLESPGHREILLGGDYRHLGVGVVVSGTQVIVTEDFTG